MVQRRQRYYGEKEWALADTILDQISQSLDGCHLPSLSPISMYLSLECIMISSRIVHSVQYNVLGWLKRAVLRSNHS